MLRRIHPQSDPRFFSKAERSRSVTEQYLTEDAVMASQIEQLPDLTGYLKLASRPEWRRVTLVKRIMLLVGHW